MKTSYPSAGKRLQKMLQLQEKGDISPDVNLNFEDDMRVDQLAEYLYPKLRNMLVQ